MPIEARQKRSSERQGEGVGEGETEKREGERVMIKLRCEPSCKLSQSKEATETRATEKTRKEAEGIDRTTNHCSFSLT